MFPKPKTYRNAKYLKWLRDQKCTICDTEPAGDAHHTLTGGMSLPGPDWSALPLCREHHSLIHTKHSKSGYWKEEELKTILAGLTADYTTKTGRIIEWDGQLQMSSHT